MLQIPVMPMMINRGRLRDAFDSFDELEHCLLPYASCLLLQFVFPSLETVKGLCPTVKIHYSLILSVSNTLMDDEGKRLQRPLQIGRCPQKRQPNKPAYCNMELHLTTISIRLAKIGRAHV